MIFFRSSRLSVIWPCELARSRACATARLVRSVASIIVLSVAFASLIACAPPKPATTTTTSADVPAASAAGAAAAGGDRPEGQLACRAKTTDGKMELYLQTGGTKGT